MELEKKIGLNGKSIGIYINLLNVIQNRKAHVLNDTLKKNNHSSSYSITNKPTITSKFTTNFKEFIYLFYTYLYRCLYNIFPLLNIQNQILKQS